MTNSPAPAQVNPETLFRQALALHTSGDAAGAIEIYVKLLQWFPQHAQILYLLGTAHFQLGNMHDAVDILGESLRIDANSADAFNSRGAAFQALNRQNEALECFDCAVRLRPDNSEFHNNLGVVLRTVKRLDEALLSVERAIQAKPDNAEAHYNRGNILRDLRRPTEALQSYERAIALSPGHALACNNRGLVLKELGRLEEALQSYARAIELNPNYAEAYNNLGAVLLDLKRPDEALHCFDRCIQLKPENWEAHNNRGAALRKLNRAEEALQSHARAVGLNPQSAEARNGLGCALLDRRHLDRALEEFDRAIALDPENAEAHNNRGFALVDSRRLDEALQEFDRAIEINPQIGDAFFNKAVLKLLLGHYDEGWELWEWRWRGGVLKNNQRPFTQPLWLGEQAISGRTILIYAEQGLGDVIQFCRYIPTLEKAGANIIFEVSPPLVSLMGSLDCAATVVPSRHELPAFDLQIPIMSLPLAFKRARIELPDVVPYLKSDPAKSAYWKGRLGRRTKPRIGVVWSGGFRPNQPDLWEVNERRNIALAKFESLNHAGVEFFSLQKGDDAVSQLKELERNSWRGPGIIDYTDELKDLADTAAFIDNLDLVISVDTSTAHLAGALGKPVWILNRFDTCWRWMLDRTDSPWYPTAVIFRQPAAGDWESVVHAVKTRLEEVF